MFSCLQKVQRMQFSKQHGAHSSVKPSFFQFQQNYYFLFQNLAPPSLFNFGQHWYQLSDYRMWCIPLLVLCAEIPPKNNRIKVHTYTDCVMLKLEKQINQLAEVPRHSLFENNLARLFPIYSILIPVYIFRILPWPQQEQRYTFAAYVHKLSFKKEKISTHRSVVSEPDPSAAVPAAPDPSVASVSEMLQFTTFKPGFRRRTLIHDSYTHKTDILHIP